MAGKSTILVVFPCIVGKMGKSDCCVSLPVGMSCYVSQLWTCNVEGQGATCRAGQEDEAYLYAKHLHCRGRYWRTWWLLMFVDSVDGKWNKMMARHGPLLGLQKSRSANTRQYFLQDISSQVPPKTKFILLTKYPFWWSWVMESAATFQSIHVFCRMQRWSWVDESWLKK